MRKEHPERKRSTAKMFNPFRLRGQSVLEEALCEHSTYPGLDTAPAGWVQTQAGSKLRLDLNPALPRDNMVMGQQELQCHVQKRPTWRINTSGL